MTEIDITHIFISYISVTIRRQAKAFFDRTSKIVKHEAIEFIESFQVEKEIDDSIYNQSLDLYDSLEEKWLYQEMLLTGIKSLDQNEQFIICEKYLKNRSDADIGKEFSISGQMISKKKRKILRKLKYFLLL